MTNQEVPAFSIVVPNWNGAAFLRRGLGSLYLSARAAKQPFEIVVVDDQSDDESAQLIQEEFPSVRLFVNEVNRGFGATANRGVRESHGDVVILCNNDLIAREEFAPFLLVPMANPNVFAVSGQTIDWEDGAPNHVEMHAAWRDGMLAQDYTTPESLCETTFFQGGACAIRRSLFLEYGGFCELFAPGYWEDYDMAYLAKKAGWQILYEPRAIANHLGKGSMTMRYGRDRLAIIQSRNQILFTWLNTSDARLLAKHCMEFPAALVRDMARTENSPLTKGFLRALPKLTKVLSNRKFRRKFWQLTDREILQ